MAGANMVLMVRLTAKAVATFFAPIGPARAAGAQSSPRLFMAAGAPAEKMAKARVMHTPSSPHTTARGTSPKPSGNQRPLRRRWARLSPNVASRANLQNPAT